MEDNKIIIEELGRIKNLMGYDRSKTLNENINEADGIVDKVYRWLLPSGDIVKGTDIKGKIPKGSKLLNGVNYKIEEPRFTKTELDAITKSFQSPNF